MKTRVYYEDSFLTIYLEKNRKIGVCSSSFH